MYKHVYKPEFKLNPKAASRTKTNANRLNSGIIGTYHLIGHCDPAS
jgi:hypothetical protein